MSKMNELTLCISELRNAAQSLNSAADNLTALFADNQPEENKAIPKPKAISLEEVRAVLAEKSRNGQTAKVRELLEKHGASKLSEIDPKNYADMLAEAREFGDG